jgi:hypothetical protein
METEHRVDSHYLMTNGVDPRDHNPHVRIANALERIADALEARNEAEKLSTEFFQAVTGNTEEPVTRRFTGYKESTTLDHYLVMIDGEWFNATPEEDAFILSEINQKQKKR